MTRQIFSDRLSETLSNAVFLIALVLLYYTNTWWPGILLALWGSLITKQILKGRKFDAMITTILLLSLFFSTLMNLSWHIYIPLLFILCGLYLIVREYFAYDTNQDIIDINRHEE